MSEDTVVEGSGDHRYKVQSRRARIVEQLEEHDFLSVKDLAESFDMTEMSLRRDLAALEKDGFLSRVRGGATRSRRGQTSRHYAEATRKHTQAKGRIAREAASRLEAGSVVCLYSGSTVARVASMIPLEVRSSMTVVTNSLPIIDEASTWAEPHLVAVGGLYLPAYMTFVGPQTISSLEAVNVDVAVVGCDGMSADGGLTTPHQLVAEVGATIIGRARQTIVVADSSKIGRRGFTPIAPIEAVDVLVTDAKADEDEVAAMRSRGLDVSLV